MIDRIDALERLAKLKADGVITHVEFEQQKAQILRGNVATPVVDRPTLRQRWAAAREQSSGVRRIFRWFWGLQLAAIVLVGIYFLTRGQTLQDARNTAAPAHIQPVSAPTGDAATFKPVTASPPNLIVTDLTLSQRPEWNTLEDDPNPLTLCESVKMRVANSSSRTLNLEGSGLASDVSWTIGVVKPGEQIEFDVGKEGTFALADITDDKPITRFDVAKCDSSGNFLQ